MADVETNALTLEVLKDIRTEMRGMRSEMTGMRTEMTGMRSEMTGIRTELSASQAEMSETRAEMTLRFEAIEQTLVDSNTQLVFLARHARSASQKRSHLGSRVDSLENRVTDLEEND